MIFNRIHQKNLIKGCIRGDRDAHKQLYDTYADDMFKVCLSYAPDYDSANDMLQEGFLKVFQKIHKYKNTGALGGWIRTVIVHNCIDLIRSDKWSKLSTELNTEYNVEDNIISINDSIKKFENDDFLALIKDLPAGYKIVLNLYFLEDYTHKEIAETLNITVGTSKSQLSKAKAYLKNILVKTLSEEELSQYGGLDKRVV